MGIEIWIPLVGLAGLKVVSFFVCDFFLARICVGGGGEVNFSMFIGADKFSEIYF